MTLGEIQTNASAVRTPLSHAVTPVQAAVAAAPPRPPARRRRRSLSQLRLALQIISSLSRGGVMEQLSSHLCNYDQQRVTIVSGYFIALS